MANTELNLDWLISTQGDFLFEFGIDRDKIISDYATWKQTSSSNSVIDYFCELLRQASLSNIKNANTEEEFYNSKLQLDIKMLEFLTRTKENENYLSGQIHFDKLMISRLTLPFKFDVQINSDNCCSYCNKKNKLIFSFEKVIEKKYLPFNKCKREDLCTCTYSIIPIYDENGKLISQDVWK